MRLVLTLALAGLALCACDDPKRASKGAFAHAIDQYFENHPLCVRAPKGDIRPAGASWDGPIYPAFVEKPYLPTQEARFIETLRPFEALVKTGVLTVTDTAIEIDALYRDPARPGPAAARRYDLTDKGRKAYRPNQGGQLCYGTAVVTEVTRYSEPSSALGGTVSQVAYDYRIKDRADWSSDPAVVAAFRDLQAIPSGPLHGSTAVVLMNDGWADTRAGRLWD